MSLTKVIAMALAVMPALTYGENGTWLENIAVRKNGMVLTTRLDFPQLLRVGPTGARNASVIHTFPGVRSLLGIAAIETYVFAVLAKLFSIQTLSTPGTYAFWRVDLTSSAPNVSVIPKVPEADFLTGLALFDRTTLLSTDSAKGVIYRVKISTGKYSVFLSDPATMLSFKDSPKPVGVNGLKEHGKYVTYYSSTTGMVLARMPFNKNAQPSGPIEVIAGGFTPDDFVVTKNGTAYVTTNAENGLLKVKPSGRVTAVAEALFSSTLAGATSIAMSHDQKTLYISTAGGQFQPVSGISSSQPRWSF
ncbi:hypothetical protein BO82DRAFT_403285 [Aspergillus uvarum CBS 121591]|uniref:SMP-30/Gluconolactonase/LRE-like region domain-containing protein n=1 Tax=Aspergillus uvarum CBS 121591 TaxID=1448315 RepID=A0A319CXX3_9EURO|nr:hypothetical protein BO82DRAFT_403285 [Aspergillus uvarum CBS 121591]PYH80498.1 hypothetical protein BO82DRAFT_403285 [Aspergillus uvarum CBS 121591]